MKLHLIPVLAGSVLLAAAVASLTPEAVQALPQQQLLAQATTQQRQIRLASLNLTPKQTAQMQRIHQETRQRIEAVLTPQQLQQYNAALQPPRSEIQSSAGTQNAVLPQPGRRQNILATLNLTQEQKNRIREIMQSSRRRMNALLTAAQRSLLQQIQSTQRNQAQSR